MPDKSIQEVLKNHTARLMAISGVVGVAEGKSHGKPCVRVFVVKKSSGLLSQIPVSIEGYPVMIDESGSFRRR